MKAADFDGTYTRFSELHGKVDFVITGRGWDEFKTVDDGTKLDCPIFFNPSEEDKIMKNYPLSVVNHKADIINRAGVDVFFENMPQQVSLLKLFCPKCTIVQVEPGKDLSQYL